MVYPSSKYHELLMAEVLEPKDHNKSALDEFFVIFVNLPVLLKEICPRGNNEVIIYFLIS